MNSCDTENFPPSQLTISISELSEKVKDFGFIECQSICAFLNLVCDKKPDSQDLFWIKEKIRACLRRYDNGNEYFEPLRIIERELEAYETCQLDSSLKIF